MSKLFESAFRALGRRDMPGTAELEDGTYELRSTFKHSFFAAVGLYDGPAGAAVLKLGRQHSFFGLPLTWIGRWLAGRELAIYRLVDDLERVPTSMGSYGPAGFAHAFVEGRPMLKREPMDADFFVQLDELLAEIHRRDIAYVDLDKPENILVDDRGRPCLLDFQIAWYWPADPALRRGLKRLVPHRIGRAILAHHQASDRYHVLKHRRRCNPEGMTPEQREASHRRGLLLRLHRALATPIRRLRRRARSG